ncbi:hydroxymyristoyl-ACP dehydratase [Alkaliphilus serpentinus]|uniref:Hydroxymyristoyl-ACP dehydratase n=1 Tax=Alkaliphilus serpentinus TaxID=1482731 RepID=A0A833HNV7_9FIRM|nr:hydroxymyristoyl-ACP dehydratase [Alkaliphilus serpentinus]KAB3530022.1 hydroxymyristoyl-ACP dehydratase [Alkaliphilus serpentinus]
MMTIHCTSNCLYQQEGQCTLTHVTSISEASNKSCAYFKNKESPLKKEKS